MADNFRFAQLQSFALAGSGAVIGATSITLKSMLDIDGNSLSMATDFGTIGFGTLEPGNGTLEEQICFTGLTNNSNGTTTLSGVSSVDFQYPYTKTSGLLKTHAGSSTFVISNTSGFYDNLASKLDDEVIEGIWNFDNVPSTDQDPVAGEDLARRSWVLSVVNGGTVTQESLVVPGTAGETVAAGNPVYLKVADARWWKATGATAATLNGVQLGIAQGTGTAGNLITNGVMRRGIDTHQSGGSVGALGYVSDTSTIATSTGTTTRVVGNFLTTTTFAFDPDYFYELTAQQQAAVVGTYGTPSSTNKFVTTQGLTNMGVDQSQATQDASVTVGEANATTKHNKLAQSFVAGDWFIRGVTLNKQADTGSFTGTVTISIQADSAGAPSGSALVSRVLTNAVWLRYPTGTFTALFAADTALTSGSTYWLVIATSTSDNSNHPNVGSNSAGGYGSGIVRYNNTADGWVTISTIDLTFSTLNGLGARAVSDTNTVSGNIAAAVPGVKMKTVTATPAATVAGTGIYHGLGKTPFAVDITFAGSSTTGVGSMTLSRCTLDIVHATGSNQSAYLEPSGDAWSKNETAAYNSLSGGMCPSGNTSNSPDTGLTFTAIDENVLVVSSNNTGVTAYQFTFYA